MAGAWRVLALPVAVGIFLAGALVVRILVLPLLVLFSGSAEARALGVRTVVQVLLRLYVRLLEAAGFITVHFHGMPGKVPPGTVLVANHPSLLDAILVMSYVPEVVCVAKRSLVRAPVIGAIAKAAGFLSNDDIEGILRESEGVLKSGGRLLIFPEGTRSTPAGELRPFNPVGAGVAVRAGAPLLPVLITSKPACLYKGQPLHEILGQRFEFSVTLCDPWGPFENPNDVARQRHLRAEKTGQLQHFFEERLYG
jgi:1-acyl-sn-glycerol-3-phosphate acyltransferase